MTARTAGDSMLQSIDLRRADMAQARTTFEGICERTRCMPLALFTIQTDTDDAAIERLTIEFHRQFEAGIQDSDALTRALKGDTP